MRTFALNTIQIDINNLSSGKIMKKILSFFTAFLMSTEIIATEPISLQDITGGKFSATYVSGINPIKGTDEYARISNEGDKIIKYSFKTGKETGILFDTNDIKAIDLHRISDYVISPDGATLLIETERKRIYRRSFTAEYYIYNVKDKSVKKLSENGAQQIPTFSPDSKHIAFVRNNNIFITDGATETQVTTDGKKNEIINGIPDWVNEEEFGFNNAMAWSNDGTSLSWIKYDESKVKTVSLQLFRGDKPALKDYMDYPGEYTYKYPKAGHDNSVVSAWCYNLTNGKTAKYELPLDKDGYIPRIKTIPASEKRASSTIIIYTMNRHQDVLRLYEANPLNGNCRMIIEESVPKYVKEEAMETISFTKDHIIIPSDRDGFMHTYLYDYNGKMIKQLEKGDYDVTSIYGYDEKNGTIYLQAAAESPMNREVYAVYKNGTKKKLSGQKGWNSAIFSGDFKYFINIWSDRNSPYIFSVCSSTGKALRIMEDNKELKDKLEEYNLAEKEMFSFVTSEGIKLNGWMLKPANFDATKKYPVIMFQYSGPGSQQVVDSWSIGSMGQGGMFDYYLTQKGFIIVCVDGRGTGARGSEFEKCTYLKIGDLESKDQVETAIWLGKQPYVDAGNIGIWGWSYGGFNTLMSMSEGRKVFKAGVAVAPPTNWKYYDSVYTERYMRTPEENPTGYATNPIDRVNNLHGALLLCHGVADDNVHPQNSYEYAEAMVQADKDFKEILYTNRNHSIYGGNTRNHLLRQIATFFEKELK